MPSAPPSRYEWMDLVRGVAVSLVVLLHAVVNTESRGELFVPDWTDQVNGVVAPFRIPLLVMLSGMLLGPSLRKGTKAFFAGKLRRIGWPFLVWTGVFVLVTTRVESTLLYLGGGTYLWYLLFLLLYYAAAWALRDLPPTLVVALTWAGSLLAVDDTKYGERLLYLFGLFVLGSMLASRPRLWRWVQHSPWALLAGLGLLGVQALLRDPLAGYGPLTVPATLGGFVLGLQASSRLGAGRLTAPLRYVGRHSLVYYVVHFPVMLVVVAALTRLGVENGSAVALACAVVAFAASTLLAVNRERAWLRWLFVAPWGERGRPARPVPTGADR